MDRPKLEVADIFRRYGVAYRQQHEGSLSAAQRRVMTAIEMCRTAALGGHLERCDCCHHERPCYDSCGDRHCPKCQSLARAAWVEKRTAEVLQTHYFHVVFTVPEQIASIAYQNKDLVYGILFRATAETLSTIAADPQHLGAEIGFFAILHSWGQNLFFHPHLHCVVPDGGISLDGARWISYRPNFFLPVNVVFAFLLFASAPPGPPGFQPPSRSGTRWGMGRLRQAPFRRATARAGLCRPLH